MSDNINEQLTRNYEFGVDDASAPSLGLDAVTSAELKYEPEVYAKAQDGEGHSIALARTAPKCTGTFTGYILTPEFSIDEFFTFEDMTFVVTSFSRPRRKGEFLEVTVEATGYEGLPAI